MEVRWSPIPSRPRRCRYQAVLPLDDLLSRRRPGRLPRHRQRTDRKSDRAGGAGADAGRVRSSSICPAAIWSMKPRWRRRCASHRIAGRGDLDVRRCSVGPDADAEPRKTSERHRNVAYRRETHAASHRNTRRSRRFDRSRRSSRAAPRSAQSMPSTGRAGPRRTRDEAAALPSTVGSLSR